MSDSSLNRPARHRTQVTAVRGGRVRGMLWSGNRAGSDSEPFGFRSVWQGAASQRT